MYTFDLLAVLLTGTASASASATASVPCPPQYHLAFSTNQNTSSPVYRAARLIDAADMSTIYIVAGDVIPSPGPITAGALAGFNGTGSRKCLSLSSGSIEDAGLSIGTPRIDPSGPAYAYPIITTPGSAGDCRWYLGADVDRVSVFPGIYEANEGLYACSTRIGDGVYDVLSLGKTGGGLESPTGCVYSVAAAFRQI